MNKLEARSAFEVFLKESKWRVTYERMEILDAIDLTTEHFDADRLFFTLKKGNSKISRATVYNTLEKLHQCGLISRSSFGNRLTKYEKSYDRPNHDHLICLECNGIIEFSSEPYASISSKICRENNFTLKSSSLHIFGICSRCVENQKAPQ